MSSEEEKPKPKKGKPKESSTKPQEPQKPQDQIEAKPQQTYAKMTRDVKSLVIRSYMDGKRFLAQSHNEGKKRFRLDKQAVPQVIPGEQLIFGLEYELKALAIIKIMF